ncbi:MAG: FG-GAP-like repeat-containing protein [Candidatus Magnetobacterium sp. LHC-1]
MISRIRLTHSYILHIVSVSIVFLSMLCISVQSVYAACSGKDCATLTVTKSGNGSGTVTSDPSGIDCGETCSDKFNKGIQVVLTATGSTFAGWSGGGCSGTGDCKITMSADTTVTATFTGGTPTSYTVNATAGTGGSISPSTRTVTSGATTTFTVTPDAGYTASVTGCGGSLSGNTYTTGAITADCTVTATFSQTPSTTYTVTATAGTGGAITPSTQTVASGATTTFTVTPNTGYSIASVTGCGGSLSGNTYTTGAITADCTVTATFTSGQPTPSTSNVIAYKGDFNGDGVSDILFRNNSSGLVLVWFMTDGKYSRDTAYEYVSSDWTITAIADFNGDGRSDILWQHSSGSVAMWITSSDGMSVTRSWVTFNGDIASVGSNPDWKVLGTGKLGGANATVLWHNAKTGDVAVWQMNGATTTSRAFVTQSQTLTLQFKGIADFNGDGTDDILWQDSSTSQVTMWIMSGIGIETNSIVGSSSSEWAYKGAAAFNGGTKAQILWQNTTTEVPELTR